ncbi:CRISPR-associated endonuclease Cas1 [Thermoproteota archaeon]
MKDNSQRNRKHVKCLIVESRKNFKAYDGTNNIFNLAYEILSWKVHRAFIKAKLESYLGFLHSLQYGKQI